MRITERKLLKTLQGLTNGGDFYSIINNDEYFWSYDWLRLRDEYRRNNISVIKYSHHRNGTDNHFFITEPDRCMAKEEKTKAIKLFKNWENSVRGNK